MSIRVRVPVSLRSRRRIRTWLLVLWRVGIRSLDLHKTFGADGLVAAAGCVQVRRIVQKADWTFGGVLVQEYLDRLPVD